MEKEQLSRLLKKYVNGECTPEEIKLVDGWFLSHEDNPDDDRLLDIDERESLETKMLERIKASLAQEATVLKSASTTKTWYRAAAAIAALMVSGLGLYLYNQEGLFTDNGLQGPIAKIVNVTNNTGSVVREVLSDGTVIMLQPQGSLEFFEEFPSDKREIKLTGEAFFDVTKDKNRPFVINTGDVTVKVLGTSFNVRAYEGAKEISVAVKTGKVSVYAKGDVDAKKAASKEEIILTPNQEVVYNTIDENFSRRIVEDPQIILEKPTLFAMEYDATPVAKIFQVIEENYGIDIVYDEQMLSACSLTTSLSEEGLYERLEIICQAIGAKYEMKDAKIFVSSDGCQ